MNKSNIKEKKYLWKYMYVNIENIIRYIKVKDM